MGFKQRNEVFVVLLIRFSNPLFLYFSNDSIFKSYKKIRMHAIGKKSFLTTIAIIWCKASQNNTYNNYFSVFVPVSYTVSFSSIACKTRVDNITSLCYSTLLGTKDNP